jgi:glutaryl-CoA dehydrogenase
MPRADAILPKSGGLKSPLMCLTQARYGISWGAIGAAMACFEEALSYSRNRVMFDKPHRRVPAAAGAPGRDADRDREGAARLAAPRTLKDLGKMTPQQVSLAKRNNVNMATTSRAKRAASWRERHPRRVSRRCGTWPTWRACTRTRARTTSTRLILGQAVTGINAFN